MGRRSLRGLAAVVALGLGMGFGLAREAGAGALEDALRDRWLGAWVVLAAEVGSGCGDLFTNNRVQDGRTVHKAEFVLPAGELAKVVKLDVKRARTDVFVELSEPLLTSRIDGPFELFDPLSCRVELQVAMPRAVIKKQDAAAAAEILGRILERHENRQLAEGSGRWNRRRVELVPADYQSTLDEYHEWKQRQFVADLRIRLDEALEEAADIVERARRSASYAEGLAEGLRRRRSSSLGRQCESLVDASIYPSSGDPPEGYEGSERDWEEGYRGGQRLAFSIELAGRLELCLR